MGKISNLPASISIISTSLESTEIAGGAHCLKAGANIIKAGQYSGEIGHQRESIHRDQQKAGHKDHHIGHQIGISIGQHLFLHSLTVQPHHLYLLGMDDLAHAPQHIFYQQQGSAAFETASRTACAGAD